MKPSKQAVEGRFGPGLCADQIHVASAFHNAKRRKLAFALLFLSMLMTPAIPAAEYVEIKVGLNSKTGQGIRFRKDLETTFPIFCCWLLSKAWREDHACSPVAFGSTGRPRDGECSLAGLLFRKLLETERPANPDAHRSVLAGLRIFGSDNRV